MSVKYKVPPCLYDDEGKAQFHIANELAEIAKTLKVQVQLKGIELQEKESKMIKNINYLMSKVEIE